MSARSGSPGARYGRGEQGGLRHGHHDTTGSQPPFRRRSAPRAGPRTAGTVAVCPPRPRPRRSCARPSSEGAGRWRSSGELWAEGHEVVVGVDEVGRGAWAGPLTRRRRGACPQDRRVNKIRDSKMLTEREREAMFDRIAEWCVTWAVGHASRRSATSSACRRPSGWPPAGPSTASGVVPDQVLIDGNWDFVGGGNTRRIVKGDATCLSIAAASILAKVTRDRIMRAEAEHYPGYDFESTRATRAPATRWRCGHGARRRSTAGRWVFMDHLPWTGVERSSRPPAGAAGHPPVLTEVPGGQPQPGGDCGGGGWGGGGCQPGGACSGWLLLWGPLLAVRRLGPVGGCPVRRLGVSRSPARLPRAAAARACASSSAGPAARRPRSARRTGRGRRPAR